jgi:hypothetical protein
VDEGNVIKVGMYDFLLDTQAMEGMLLDSFQGNELGDDADVVDSFYEKLGICFHHPSIWSSTRVCKVYPSRDNNVIIQLESNVWYVKRVFLDTFEVTNH